MKIEVGFGEGIQKAEVPEENIIKILKANPVEDGLKGREAVEASLKEPIGAPLLREIVKPGEKIAIITSDITRPMPTWEVMPAVLDELYAAGAKAEDITLVFALGSHRGHTEEEKKKLAGERAYKK